MWGSVIFGMVVGMSVYIAIGGEHYAMMIAVTAVCSMIGVGLAQIAVRR